MHLFINFYNKRIHLKCFDNSYSRVFFNRELVFGKDGNCVLRLYHIRIRPLTKFYSCYYLSFFNQKHRTRDIKKNFDLSRVYNNLRVKLKISKSIFHIKSNKKRLLLLTSHI